VRYLSAGYKILAITDHADYSNIDTVISSIVKFTEKWPAGCAIKVLPGVELTHLPLQQFVPLVKYARKNKIKVIIGHGETVVEPVIPGTNRVAIESGVDILAHPGKISDADVKLAKKKGVLLEISSRRGHCLTNKFVAQKARRFGARIVLSHDSHDPEDIITPRDTVMIGLKAGLSVKEVRKTALEINRFMAYRS
jgi:histidinol phosphatase-like PHP family hydrolase